MSRKFAILPLPRPKAMSDDKSDRLYVHELDGTMRQFFPDGPLNKVDLCSDGSTRSPGSMRTSSWLAPASARTAPLCSSTPISPDGRWRSPRPGRV